MGDEVRASRRTFLHASALTAGSVILAGCSGGSSVSRTVKKGTEAGTWGPTGRKTGKNVGSAQRPVAAPPDFQEAPSLKGKNLPQVRTRLPEDPLVLPHKWTTRGHYGGTLNIPVFGSTGMANASSCRQFFYGPSPARWLNDGLDIGPGIADRWSSNNDASEWTIHFRTGLRWSDGHLFSVDDVIFWYKDIAIPGHDGQGIPEDCLSAKGNPCTMVKVDGSTLKLHYDAPQPLLPDRLASNPKGGIGQNGTPWLYPKHYLRQFHPKYNPNVPKEWDATGGLWERKADWLQNPECPTLTGFRCRSFDNNSGVILERNPYYYVVTPDGDQLPYLDTIRFKLYQNAEVIKLQVQQGTADYCHGPYNQIDLSDVSPLSRSTKRGNYRLLLWDSGSGTGAMFFLNLDYPEKRYRDLFNDKRFRQAISYGYDRKTANKTLYFQTGNLTTGTMSPKALSFHTPPDGPRTFQRWRDSYKEYDLKRARELLTELGLKDQDNDGYVEFSDGTKLTVDVPFSADISSTYTAADDQLISDMKKIGLRMTRRPIPPQAYQDAWSSGQFMAHTNWEVSGAPTLLAQPQFIVPIEASRWAPLQGMWQALRGSGKDRTELDKDPWKRHPPRRAPEPGSPVDQLTKLFHQAYLEPDQLRRERLVWEMIRVHIDDGPFFMGSTAGYPQVVIVHTDLRNVPDRDNLTQGGWTNPWNIPCPGAYDPECFYWRNPSAHA